LKYRADTPLRLGALIKLEPEFGMSHVLKGYFMMLGFKEALVSVARESEAAAGKLAGAMNGRERAHLFALRHWIAGDVERTLRSWDETDFSSGLTTDVARCEKTRASADHVAAYPAAVKKFLHSVWVKQSMMRPMALQRPSTDRRLYAGEP
jgi:hypothetical protein